MEVERSGCAFCFACLSRQRDEVVAVPSITCSACGAHHHPECWARNEQCAHCHNQQGVQQEVLVPALEPPARPRVPLRMGPLPAVYMFGKRAFPGRVLVRAGTFLFVAGVLFLWTMSAIMRLNAQPPTTSVAITAIPSLSSITPLPATPPPMPTPTPPPPTPTMIPLGAARIQRTDVHLRSSASQASTSLGILMRGSVVEVIGDAELQEGNLWVRVQANRQIGWVNQSYLLPGPPLPGQRARVSGAKPNTLRLRSEPSANASVIDRLSEGTEVDLLGETARSDDIIWQLVRIDEREGWVDQSFLEPIR